MRAHAALLVIATLLLIYETGIQATGAHFFSLRGSATSKFRKSSDVDSRRSSESRRYGDLGMAERERGFFVSVFQSSIFINTEAEEVIKSPTPASPSAVVLSREEWGDRQRYERCRAWGNLSQNAQCAAGLVCKRQAMSDKMTDWKAFCTRPAPLEPSLPEPLPIQYSENDPRADVPLKHYRFLMAHNAATGYFKGSSAVTRGMVETQTGTLYDQLSCGARALDLRIYASESGELYFHHTVPIRTTFAEAMRDVQRWEEQGNHKSDDANLVLLIARRCEDKSSGNTPCEERIQKAFENASVPFVRSSDMRGMTYRKALKLARGSPRGGILLGILDGDDAIMDNYTELFEKDSCRGAVPMCYEAPAALNTLLGHVDPAVLFGLQSYKPLHQVQLLWQSGPEFPVRILSGMSILDDVHFTGINFDVYEYLRKSRASDRPLLNLVTMDNVCEWGRSIYGVLREWNNPTAHGSSGD